MEAGSLRTLLRIQRMSKRVALYIGRWSPVHEGHKWLIDRALEQGKNVCIGIRDTDVCEKDPYTYKQRERMWRKVYGDKVDIMRFPDIESINIGRKVGYEINREDPPEDIGNVSATRARAGEMGLVPEETRSYAKLLESTIWLTGMPCSGKTTILEKAKPRFEDAKCNVVHLDGDVLRHGLCADLKFSDEDRAENLRRVAYLAKMFNDRKTTVLASFVSPTNELRDMVKSILGDKLVLVYVKCSAAECAKRDVKGMWAKAIAGEITGFTGHDAPFEVPEDADLVINTQDMTLEESVEALCHYLGM